ncbi:MAG: L-dopachrome tautomerase-related protein, partial [Xenococcaceae cyanobacterium MO_234.B1]|nr:L-dopachrome tautomerase-related protein [Xenococcaceae cyanobacterium MO_234.B1]
MSANLNNRLEVVAELTLAPGNITLTPEGQIFVSLHQFYSPEMRVVEITTDGKLIAFPNREWSEGGQVEQIALDSVLGIQSDTNGIVWMLDNGIRGKSTPKLVGWDTRDRELARLIYLPPPIAPDNAFVNDLAVDLTHNAIYIADPAGGENAALIVVDLKTGWARRVLQRHQSVMPEEIDLAIDGVPVRVKQSDGTIIRPREGVNPIALDAQNEWLYFGPMHGTSIYRIQTVDLCNPNLSVAELASRVELYSDKPISDGISIDQEGNIYISELAANGIGAITTDRRYQRLITDERLSWPDAFSFGPDGYLYVTSNQLHRSASLNAG